MNPKHPQQPRVHHLAVPPNWKDGPARCAWGKREGMKSRRECHCDLETLVWTRGQTFRSPALMAALCARVAAAGGWCLCFSRPRFPNQQEDEHWEE